MNDDDLSQICLQDLKFGIQIVALQQLRMVNWKQTL